MVGSYSDKKSQLRERLQCIIFWYKEENGLKINKWNACWLMC